MVVGRLESCRCQPLMVPCISAFLMGVTELTFLLVLGDPTPVLVCCARVLLTLFLGMLFTQALACRDSISDWLCSGVLVLALAQVRLGPIGLGFGAVGALTAVAPFPAAVLAGLGVDLARVTKVPMAATACLGYFLRLVPYPHRWQQYMAPVAACLGVSWACGVWDGEVLPGLLLGG